MESRTFLKLLVIILFLSGTNLTAQNKPRIKSKGQITEGTEITILVTAYPHNDGQFRIAAGLQNSDFAVLENKRSQSIISVRGSKELPIDLAVVVQDNLDWRFNSEIRVLKDFILNLPVGSRVMTAYLTNGGAIVTQELIADRKQAADSLRIIRGGSFPPTFSPYDGVQTVLKHFEKDADRRKMVLVLSDGLDMSLGYNYASPYFSISLGKSIKEAQRVGVPIFAIYAPSDDRETFGRLARNYGQGSLIRLADETGGESYIGLDRVDIAVFLKEFREVMQYQWMITYRSASSGTEFRRIEVTTDFDIHLHHAVGYEPGQ